MRDAPGGRWPNDHLHLHRRRPDLAGGVPGFDRNRRLLVQQWAVENCANVAIAAATGIDSNLADNKSCVTVTKDGFDKPKDPPPVPKVCGLNVIFVVDESGSIDTAGATGNVLSALTSAASIFNTNGSKAALIHFSDNAQTVLPLATTTYGSITTGYAPTGGTNWEAGLAAALALPPGSNSIIKSHHRRRSDSLSDGSGTVHSTDQFHPRHQRSHPGRQSDLYGRRPDHRHRYRRHLHPSQCAVGRQCASTTYSGLSGTLTDLAKELCPTPYLSKSISPNYINYHNNPGPHQVTVTLTLNTRQTPDQRRRAKTRCCQSSRTPIGFSARLGTASAIR